MLAGKEPPKGLRLDLRGTPFQIRVWTALQAIPLGETRTYQQIAQSLGAPKASRAVGSACGNNIIGVLVPCHRALRSDGGLGGYRWGLDRKENCSPARASNSSRQNSLRHTAAIISRPSAQIRPAMIALHGRGTCSPLE